MGGGEEAEPLPDTHGTLAVLSRRTGPAQGISRLAGVRRRMTRKKGGGGRSHIIFGRTVAPLLPPPPSYSRIRRLGGGRLFNVLHLFSTIYSTWGCRIILHSFP